MHTGLKILVIGLGVLIALAFGLLVYGFAKTSQDPNWRLFGDSPTSAKPNSESTVIPLTLASDIKLDLPSGCAITDIKAIGPLMYIMTGPRMTAAVQSSDETAGCGQVIVIDPAKGHVTGRLIP